MPRQSPKNVMALLFALFVLVILQLSFSIPSPRPG